MDEPIRSVRHKMDKNIVKIIKQKLLNLWVTLNSKDLKAEVIQFCRSQPKIKKLIVIVYQICGWRQA